MKTRCRGLWLCGSLVVLVALQFGCASAAKTQTQQVMTPRLEARGTYSANMDLSCCRTECSLYIPLWVQIPPSRAIYRTPMLGVKIERIEADGREIRPWDILVNQEWGDLFVSPQVDEVFFVYQLKAAPWNYQWSGDEDKRPKNWSDYEVRNVKNLKNACDQVVYRIPYDTRRIRIEYRLRYLVDGGIELGPMLTVIAERNDNTLMEN
jgi:hypothetical protein